MVDRVILHCDCNSFFASVETALDPSYFGVPMAVCGIEKDRHGIVLAKNELAKAFGIKTAETVYSAKKKCPELVIVRPHYDEYVKYSRRVNSIYAEYTDLIESFGIDESWLDITASQRFFGSPMEIADQIRQRIKEEIGITVSIGISFNKVFAKLGSDYKKPDAITYIGRENFKEIVYPLPVEELLFVGQKTAQELRRLGVKTIGELASISETTLISKFGKLGCMLYKYSNGLDDEPVVTNAHSSRKSMSNGFTFRRDLTSISEWRVSIYFLAEEIGYKLRGLGLLAEGVSLTIKDEYLKSIQRQRRLNKPTDISSDIAECALNILLDEWSEQKPIRMLTVTVFNLFDLSRHAEQIDMFDNGLDDHKKSKIKEETVDIIRQKYGNNAIIRGSLIGTDLGFMNTEED